MFECKWMDFGLVVGDLRGDWVVESNGCWIDDAGYLFRQRNFF